MDTLFIASRIPGAPTVCLVSTFALKKSTMFHTLFNIPMIYAKESCFSKNVNGSKNKTPEGEDLISHSYLLSPGA